MPQLPAPNPDNRKDYLFQRFFEIVPGFLTWVTLVGCVVLSIFAPIWAAIFIIAFDFYWLLRAIYVAIYSVIAYRRMQQWIVIDWMKKLKSLEGYDKNWRNVYHAIILPTVNEGVEVIGPAIEALYNSNYPKDKIIVVLATEARTGEEAIRKAKILEEKYGDKFFAYFTSVHPDKIPGEAKTKGANATYAAKRLKEFLDEKNIDYENVVVSAFDCDTCVHPQYFACIAYNWVTHPNRARISYQPLPMYHNNIWDTNAFVRVIVTGSSFWHMIESIRPERLVTFSSHSMSFKALVEVEYWPVNVISDDSIIFWKCYLYYEGDYETVPVFLPVSLDAVLAKTYARTIINQYKQKRRWAYGIEDFPLVARGFLRSKKIRLFDKFRHMFIMLEGHHSWATGSFIVILLGWPTIYFGGDEFRQTILAHNLPNVLRDLMTFAMIGLITSMFLSLLLLPPRPARYSRKKYIWMILQWVLTPIIAIPLGAVPAIDAQTRLMFGRYFVDFWVTDKVRKEEASPCQII